MYKLKLTCYTPRDQAKKCSKGFAMKHFGFASKPIETKVMSDTEFYHIWEFEKEKQMDRVIGKIPKAEQSIRQVHIILFHIIGRGNKLAKKFAWSLEKTRRWMLKRLKQKVKDPKEMEDFINVIEINDEEELREFLAGELFKYEILEGGI